MKYACQNGVCGYDFPELPLVRRCVPMNESHKTEIGRRIAELRDRSPYTQERLAGELGLTLRAYQKLEQLGTTRYTRCEEVARAHEPWTSKHPEWQHVDADWIWDGIDRTQTPPTLVDPGVQLDRIEQKLDAVLEAVALVAMGQGEAAALAARQRARQAPTTSESGPDGKDHDPPHTAGG